MTKFAIIVHGVNFLVRDANNSEPELRGFYVSAFIEAETEHQAEAEAIELVRKSLRPRVTVDNSDDDPPRLLIDEVAQLTGWPDKCTRPLSGFAFYNESDDAS
jgi:hypothetical protein